MAHVLCGTNRSVTCNARLLSCGIDTCRCTRKRPRRGNLRRETRNHRLSCRIKLGNGTLPPPLVVGLRGIMSLRTPEGAARNCRELENTSSPPSKNSRSHGRGLRALCRDSSLDSGEAMRRRGETRLERERKRGIRYHHQHQKHRWGPYLIKPFPLAS